MIKTVSASSVNPLSLFSEPVSVWFEREFGRPTTPQERGWPPIQRGENTLILAPTGSGKTLAAFLWGIDRILQELRQHEFEELRLVYVSPLKALNNDIERNLRQPLRGIREVGKQLGVEMPTVRVAVRSGDTPQYERRKMFVRPPHILITTPESLYILLTGSRAGELFRSVQTLIVDEIHALAGNKRGVHLALSLERLERLARRSVQRIGLSATIRPLEEVARFLGGNEWVRGERGLELRPRPVTIVDAGYRKPLDLRVEWAACGGNEQTGSPWIPLLNRVARLVKQHNTTLIFANNRRAAERVAERLNEILTSGEGDARAILDDGVPKGLGIFAASRGDKPRVVGVHHGSLAREKRLWVEEALKSGRLAAIVGTSSLQLGIDIGAIDLVVQIESPKSVAQGLQRVGRSGHAVGKSSKGRIFALHPEDALECAVVASGMLEGDVEPTHTPLNPLDVLAQQIVAMVSVEDWNPDELYRFVRQCWAYESLSRPLFEQVLDMLSGRYHTILHRELRPRILWDRVGRRLSALRGARMLALVNGGTIPAQGSYGVYLRDGKTKVGELDEEFIFETRVGDTFLLGNQVWRVREIRDDRVIVSEAPGSMARMPFWRGDYPWRSYEMGKRLGELRRRLAETLGKLKAESAVATYLDVLEKSDPAAREVLLAKLRTDYAVDELTAQRILKHVAEQLDGLGNVATDRLVLFEIFADALGNLQVVVHSPFGGRVNSAWALVMTSVLRDHLNVETERIANDDGILLRLPPLDVEVPVGLLQQLRPEEVRERILRELPGSAVFGARFRQNAARALLLPGLKGNRRTPFWLQRLKAKDLLEAVRSQPDFPVVLETVRDCLEEVMDLQHLLEVMDNIRTGAIQTRVVRPRTPSSLARGLMWGFMNVYVYEWDEPKSQKSVSISRDLLRDLLSSERLVRSLRPEAVRLVTNRARGLDPSVQVQSADELALLFQRVGDLSEEELRDLLPPAGWDWLNKLEQERRILVLDVPGVRGPESRWVFAEYEGDYHLAFRVGGGQAGQARRRILERFLAVSGPVSQKEVLERYAFPPEWLENVLEGLRKKGELVAGPFPVRKRDVQEERYCRRELVQDMQRRTLSILRREVESVPLPVYAHFLMRWQHLLPPAGLRGQAGVAEALEQLGALALPLDVWEKEVLPARVANFHPKELDALVSVGRLLWYRQGGDLVFLARASALAVPAPAEASDGTLPAEERLVLNVLRERGASFEAEIAAAAGLEIAVVEAALRRLAIRGLVTNDVFDLARRLPTQANSGVGTESETVQPGLPGRTGRGSIYGTGFTRAAYREAKRRARKRATLAAVRPQTPAGRWSTVPLENPDNLAQTALDWARLLLNRWGVVARDWFAAEPLVSDWSAVWTALRELEAHGEIRGGFFVSGLRGEQFALPQVVDLLRGAWDEVATPTGAALVVLNGLDPASCVLLKLQRDQKMAIPDTRHKRSTWFVVHAGVPVLVARDSGRRISTTLPLEDPLLPQALAALLERVGQRQRRVAVEFWNDVPVLQSGALELLKAAGFLREPKRLVWFRPVV